MDLFTFAEKSVDQHRVREAQEELQAEAREEAQEGQEISCVCNRENKLFHLDEKKNAKLSLSLCRCVLRLSSCWPPRDGVVLCQ